MLLFPEKERKGDEKTQVLLSSSNGGDDKNTISWPGEYDYDGIAICALGNGDSEQVSYVVTAEGMRCGFISSPTREFTEADKEIIGDLDVLVVPADDVKKVQKFVEEIDPRVVIPLKTSDEKIFAEVLAVCGGKDAEQVSEVKLKKSGLPTESREVYVLK